MFDGNGGEVFARHGWNSNTSSSLQQIFFEDSKNITIQVSLISRWSSVKISYGILKKPLNLGKISFLHSDVRLSALHEIRRAPHMLVVKLVFVDQIICKCFL